MNPLNPTDYQTILARSMLTDAYVFSLLKLVPQIAVRLGMTTFDGMPFDAAFQALAEAQLKRTLENLEDRDASLAAVVSAILDARRQGGGLFGV